MEKAGFYRLFVWRFAAVLLCRGRQVLTKPGGDVIEQRNRILLWKFNYFKFDFMKAKISKKKNRKLNAKSVKREPGKAEVFLTSLHKAAEKAFYPKAWLDAFCRDCWKFEDRQEKCFAALTTVFKFLPQAEQMELIPLLIGSSKAYPKLVLLAEELFNALPAEEQKRIKVPMVYWTMDDRETQITEAEYRWRKEHDLSCRQTETGYSRPMNADLDLKCFYAVLGMLSASGTETYIYLRGW